MLPCYNTGHTYTAYRCFTNHCFTYNTMATTIQALSMIDREFKSELSGL